MTFITGTEYKANPAKYNQRANEGERVVISSYGGYVELKPVKEEDKEIQNYGNSKAFLAASSKVRNESNEGKTLRFNTVAELRAHLASL